MRGTSQQKGHDAAIQQPMGTGLGLWVLDTTRQQISVCASVCAPCPQQCPT
ncbi:hypothetical protein PAHAL_8G067800 [Panicum hallii]|uniref:Uncharacterized protein n=1 Tax=Panicum hallii TaxID=206008 RepID=A0A2T8I802_9POAL|nr:hypothetical protein PAHAL_8G067800 [Panicum hallii]